MPRLAIILALLTACSPSNNEVATPVPATAEVQMEAVEMMIPASEAEMLREEILALRAETDRLQTELADAKAPKARTLARRTTALAELATAESKLRRLQAELDDTRKQLAVSQEKNVKLTAELQETNERLDLTEAELAETERTLVRTRNDLNDAIEVAADAAWSDLIAQTQVALCDRGSRKKLASCRADAEEYVAPLEPAVRACLRSGQATPQLRRNMDDERRPDNAVWVEPGNQDYYVLLCDPTLPEARELLARQNAQERGSVADDEPEQRVVKVVERDAPSSTVKTARRVPATAALRPSMERETASLEPDLQLDLLDDEPDLSALGLIDLDDDGDDRKRKDRRDEETSSDDEEEIELVERRPAALAGAGDDLDDLLGDLLDE